MNVRKRLAYCRVIWKKGLLLLPRFLIAIVCVAVVLTGVVYGFYTYVQKDQVLPKAKVAIVTVPGDLVTGIGANAVANMESVKDVCEIVFMEKRAAETAMEQGEIDAAIYLTEDIYDNIENGENTPVRVQLASKAHMGLNVFEDLMATGMTLLQTGQAMVYSLGSAAHGRETSQSVPDLMDSMAMDYLDLAINRSTVWRSKLVSAYGDIPATDFYIMTMILVIVCVFLGMGFGGLYDRQGRTVEQCLRRTGIGMGTGTFARMSVITAVIWTLTAVIVCAMGLFTEFSEFRPIQLLLLLGLAFSIAGLVHLIHSWMAGSNGTIFYLLIMILMFVAGGGLFPSAYLPAAVQKIVPFLPVSLWQKYLVDTIWREISVTTVVQVLALGAAMMIAGSVGLRYREDH